MAIDSLHAVENTNLIVEEVVPRLNSHVDCEVGLTLEIDAKLVDGFDKATTRTVSDNSRTLGFGRQGPEER